jgi:hypothetical protein
MWTEHRIRRPLRIPSRTHEARRSLLETLADISGFRRELILPGGDRPDVLRRLDNGRGLFVGEAKHSEGPSDMPSVDRLDRYLGWLMSVERTGGFAVLAIAHSPGLHVAWRARLEWLLAGREASGDVWSAPVAMEMVVSVLVLGHAVPKGKQNARGTCYSAV